MNTNTIASQARRWLPRFSLRTLLLCTLLIGSGTTLWGHCDAWNHALTFPGAHDKKLGTGDGYQTLATFSPDGSKLCHCGNSTFPRVCDAATGAELFAFTGQIDAVVSVRYSPDGRWIVSAGSDGLARLWNAHTGKEIRSFQGHKGAISYATFSQDFAKIITAGSDATARIWNVSTGDEARRLFEDFGELRDPGPMQCAAFGPGGKTVATISVSRICFWDTTSGKQIVAIPTETSHFSCAFSPDGLKLLTGCWDGKARIWNISDDGIMGVLSGHDPNKHIHTAEFMCDGEKIMTASCDNSVRVWDTVTSAELASMKGQPDLISASVSPDSKFIASASRDGTVWIWHRRRPEPWWGIAWLPEFWLTLIFAAAFAWSALRDRTAI